MLGQQTVPFVYSEPMSDWSNSRIQAWVDGLSTIARLAPRMTEESEYVGASRPGLREVLESRDREMAQLREEKERAERADRMKSLFVAHVSHEIRNMLGPVIAYSELLKAEDQGPIERAEALGGITRSSEELMTLVNDLVEMVKMEEGRIEIVKREFGLRDLIRDLEHFARAETKKKGLDFRVEVGVGLPESLHSDHCRIKQILLNLLGNAIKFTESGAITFSVMRDGQEPGSLRFLVRDTGIGMTPEQTGRLFEPFSQLSQAGQGHYRGAGLGLVISRDIARLLDGDLRILESRLGCGTVFEFGLRVGEDRVKTAERVIMEPFSGIEAEILGGLRVLVADDSADNQRLISRFLRRAGAVVETAADGIEALEKALAGDFDVVFLDIQMPRLDGYQAIHELRSRGFTNPAVALTAYVSHADEELCLRSGFSVHLPKPICRNTLMRAVSKLFQA